MERKPANFDRDAQVWATRRACERVKKIAELACAVGGDTLREERMKKYECKACFYPGRIHGRMGGAAMTTQPCACCGAPQTYGSTATDLLCMGCAKEHSLCKHCGGDQEMRILPPPAATKPT
ncbi:hypothetical protein [uncultured Variovorax sp.]|uniref:hypothetical protein n=1 Tax=uncultured Variovorax sp. TaxID=114708 RepID=UPI0026029CB3|nr:hypothetical protein [uncultured Variovorax sp.]